MSEHHITLIEPASCSEEQLRQFHDLVISGNQVQAEGLPERIASAALLAFAHADGQLAGVASIKNQKRSYITGIFLKAKVPRLAGDFDHEIGYAVTHKDYRRRGISRELIGRLMDSKPQAGFYATTKNEGMRILLEQIGFKKTGHPYQNLNAEVLDVYTYCKKIF
ncbi:GNAT family N-acetyltransferase [Mucilaginibacter ginsenosidivorans]|jgi:predicted GNAT family acetyltransferase|uniref:GNAT family N-acetyltransferase n=1 Tax=Mucilaginibacter ginsenosidivorans TaxID=398053 RepID=A0A5B8UU30_9SPHI|nr:GNAT family N-acetyltransferase [Mucilaginibacter ginsenosidivorans]QEC62398.1 GNAT family N-acetyltransferase [Mucilaginibacter ginsenosidivorans]